MDILGILFDIGDTLLPATELQRRIIARTAALLKKEGIIPTPKAFVEAYAAADADPDFESLNDLNHLYSDRRVIARAFELLDRTIDEETAEHFLSTYRFLLRENIRPAPSITECLRSLQMCGKKLAIVSNGTTDEQLDQLSLLAIREFFDPIVISQEVGIRKPDARCFHLVADAWKCSPTRLLVVGDRPDWEVVGAKRAGMLSALTIQFVDYRAAIDPEYQPDYVINDLSMLLAITEVT